MIMAGYVYGTVLEELYANAAVFVLPSLLEGLPDAAGGGQLRLLDRGQRHPAPPRGHRCPGPGACVFPAGDVHQLTKAITEALQAPPDEERAGAEAPVGARAQDVLLGHRVTETDAVYRHVQGRRSVLSRGRQRAAR